MCARIAIHLGAGRVIGVDNVAERLAMASRHGVQTVDYSAVDSVRDVILNLTDGRGLDSAIDAVGMEAGGSLVGSILQSTKLQLDRATALRDSMSALRRGGTLSLTGVYAGRSRPSQQDLFDMQIQLRMGQANVWQWVEDILPLLTGDDDPLGVEDLKTHEMPLEDAPLG